MTRELQRRIARLETRAPAMRMAVSDQLEVNRFVDYVGGYNDVAVSVRLEIAEQGQQATVQRVLDAGSELERVALLTQLGHCPHTFMLLVALDAFDRGGQPDWLLAWWRDASTIILHGLLGEPVGQPEPFHWSPSSLDDITTDKQALRAFDKHRQRLERGQNA